MFNTPLAIQDTIVCIDPTLSLHLFFCTHVVIAYLVKVTPVIAALPLERTMQFFCIPLRGSTRWHLATDTHASGVILVDLSLAYTAALSGHTILVYARLSHTLIMSSMLTLQTLCLSCATRLHAINELCLTMDRNVRINAASKLFLTRNRNPVCIHAHTQALMAYSDRCMAHNPALTLNPKQLPPLPTIKLISWLTMYLPPWERSHSRLR